jgi:hypothetical protein
MMTLSGADCDCSKRNGGTMRWIKRLIGWNSQTVRPRSSGPRTGTISPPSID